MSTSWAGPALERALDSVVARLGTKGYPHVTQNGHWTISENGFWTGGFWIGLLWAGYEERRDERFRVAAERALQGFMDRAGEQHNHDLGMMFCPSAVKGFLLTGKEHYRQAALRAAASLAAQFNEKGRFIPGWGFFGKEEWAGAVLVDTLMNVPLLLWAASESGDDNFRRVALAHGATSLAHHLRPDGSTYHVYRFDGATGEPLGPATYQGKSATSCWSRGQAWAIAGCATLARLGAGDEYLNAAHKAASYYLANLPADKVPFWDFEAVGPTEPRDSSAAAIAAYGMLLLGQQRADLQLAAASCLRALTEFAQAPNGHEAILLHATADLPHGIGVDESTIYGDYFFVRALQYLNKQGRRAGQPLARKRPPEIRKETGA